MIAGELKKLIGNRRTVLIVIAVILLNILCSLYMSYGHTDKTTGLSAQDLKKAFDHYATGTASEVLESLEEKQAAIMSLWFDENGNIRQPGEDLIKSLTPVTGSISKELKSIAAIYEYAEQINGYGDYLAGIQKNAEEIIQSPLTRRSDYTVRNIEDTAARYKNLTADNVTLYAYFGAGSILNNSISVFIVIVSSLYFCLELFVSDKYEGTLTLIKTARNSRGKLFAAKAATLCITVFVIYTVIYLTNTLTASSVYGLGNLTVRIQSVTGYYTSPWDINVGQCLVLSYAAGALGVLALALFISLLCIVSGNIIRAVGLTAGVFLAGFAAYRFIPYHSPYSLVSRINLFSIANVNGIFADYHNINICNYPVNDLACSIITLFIVLALGILLGNRAWGRLQPISTSRAGIRPRKEKTRKVRSVLGYESGKLLVYSKGAICLIMLLVAEIFLCVSFGTYESNSDRWYERYSKRLAGPYSAETQESMDNIDGEFDEINRQIAEYRKKAAAGEMSSDYADYLIKSITPGIDQKTGYSKAKAQFEYVKRQVQSGKASEFVPTVPYEKLLDCREAILCSIPRILVISVCIPIYASIERRYGMDPIITSTCEGKTRTLKKKRVVVIGFSLVSVALTYLPRTIMKLLAFPLQMPGSPANSLQYFEWAPNWISIGLILLVTAALRILAVCYYDLMLFAVSRNSSRPTLIIILSLIVLLLPCLMIL